jgi:hypothetical protein
MYRLIPSSLLSSSTLSSLLTRIHDSDKFVLMADGTVARGSKEERKEVGIHIEYFANIKMRSLRVCWKCGKTLASLFAPA